MAAGAGVSAGVSISRGWCVLLRVGVGGAGEVTVCVCVFERTWGQQGAEDGATAIHAFPPQNWGQALVFQQRCGRRWCKREVCMCARDTLSLPVTD